MDNQYCRGRKRIEIPDRVSIRLQQKTNHFEQVVSRYHLIVAEQAEAAVTVRVFDDRRACIVCEWQGAVAHHLLECGALPTEFSQPGSYTCDKSLVWHLILASAAAQMALDQLEPSDSDVNECRLQQCYPRAYPARKAASKHQRFQTGLETLCRRLARSNSFQAAAHYQIARTLFSHPGYHFCEEDLSCLLQLEYPSFPDRRIPPVLDDLVRWEIIQRIDVDIHNVFYDINTKPHLHIFDSRTGELRDAPVQGIMRIDFMSVATEI